MMSAYPKNHNPFAADDDEEDDGVQDFGRGRGYEDSADSHMSEAERRQKYLQQEVMRTAQSAVDSSQRSLGLIYDSEKMGIDTAEELKRQGEVLKRTERMVDNMDEDLKTSQRHINTIKSVWGGIVNYFKAKPEPNAAPEQPVAYQPSSKLQDALSQSQGHQDEYQQSHPNMRKLNTSGFGASGISPEESISSQNGYPRNQQLRAIHQQLDDNLDDMSLGLSRLKNLGLGLQTEIEDQDVTLDSLMNKVDRTDSKIRATNQQIKNLK
ncbi:synaptosomal-associated protein 29 [Brienomyrus brachyistius]|uniref:synaptosomal-associated protein 29 n=1 Tax=Brienomyrus brachyistius TaxID=42636 RepID=UPI0020B38F5D|nr:synaptosomal-associated protein 29 [Brienomyrus brachyistius]